MKRIVVFALIVMGSLAVVTPTQADPIVDTGPGMGGFASSGLLGTASGSDSDQWLAAEFITTQAWVVTSLEGWIRPGSGGDVTFAVYDDGGEVPGVELFSQSLTIPGGGADAWFGPSGLSWLLPAPGSYWAAFEVRTGSSFFGGMPSPSPSPLIVEAFYSSGTYNELDFLDLGVRINANDPGPTAAVPEPASILLLGTGLAGLLAKARRRRKQQVH